MNDITTISNDQICLKKEISDSGIIQATSLIIDEWEARLPYSPIGTFSQDTTFVKLIDHACFRIEIESQVVYRTLQENHIPDDGEKIPRGTKIILHMKDDMTEYLEERRLKDLVKKHSEFISFPISLQVEKSTEKEVTDSDDDEKKDDENDFANSALGIKKLLRNEWMNPK